MAIGNAKRLVEIGIPPRLAAELAAQITAGVGNQRRLVELSMIPSAAKLVAAAISGTSATNNQLAETGLFPRFIRELKAQVGGGPPVTGTVYYILPIIGQSNADGRGVRDTSVDTEQANIKQWANTPAASNYRTIIDTVYPKAGPDTSEANKISLAHWAAKEFAATLPANAVIVLVFCAIGGTSLVNTAANNWSNPPQWGVGRNLYEAAVATINAAIAAAKAINPSSQLLAILDNQGETDSTGSLAAQFLTAKRNQIADFRSRVTGAATAPWIISSGLPEKLATEPAFAEIDAQLRTVVADTANMHYVPGPFGQDIGDGTHFARMGGQLEGQDSGKAIAGKTLVNFDVLTASSNEGNSGTTAITRKVLRSNSVGALNVPINVALGTLSASDFVGGVVPTLTASWANGQIETTVTVNIQGDTDLETTETATLTLAPTGNVVVGQRPSMSLSVLNDDTGSGGGTNLMGSPNAFDQWTAANSSVTPNTTANPVGGAQTADTLVEAAGNATHGVNSPTTGAGTLTAGQVYTIAFDVKAVTRNFAQIVLPGALGGAVNAAWATFNITPGTQGALGAVAANNASASITALGNDWFRISLTVTIGTTGAASSITLSAQNVNVSRGGTYLGVAAQEAIRMANAQVVSGTVPNAF